jgi:ribosomal protein L20
MIVYGRLALIRRPRNLWIDRTTQSDAMRKCNYCKFITF